MKKFIVSIIVALAATSAFAESENSLVKNKVANASSKEEAIYIIVNNGKPLNLYNYVSEKNESIKKPGNLTIEQAAEYLPPIEGIIDLYFKYLEQGQKPYRAVLMSYTSEEGVKMIKSVLETQASVEKKDTSAENEMHHH